MSKENVKGALKSKTIWFGLLVSIFGFAQEHSEEINAFVPDKYDGLMTAGIGFGVILLRAITTSSLAEKGKKYG